MQNLFVVFSFIAVLSGLCTLCGSWVRIFKGFEKFYFQDTSTHFKNLALMLHFMTLC